MKKIIILIWPWLIILLFNNVVIAGQVDGVPKDVSPYRDLFFLA